ncbi:MAG: hypothetical protein Q8900_10230 [Bacillota bacterium]|nr:hypothetical protein [Bacillota bacterium]
MKPSIFSSDYNKIIKKRKRIRRIIIFIIVLIIVILPFSGKMRNVAPKSISKMYNHFTSNLKKKNKKIHTSTTPKPTDVKKETDLNSNTSDSQSSAVSNSTAGYDVQLSNGNKIKALYEEKDNVTKFTGIYPQDSSQYFDISPSGNSIVILDKSSQHVLLLNINSNGVVQDITKKQYVSSGGTTFTEDSYLGENPSYIWTDIPTFIDDIHIAYISQVPEFYVDKTTKYVWMYNIDSKDDIYIQNISGQSIKFQKTNSGDLQVNVDGNINILGADGTIKQ